ncbi:Flagellar basal-body rod protein FlgG [Defluviimonas aquaemixtae]|uniref:Flagellar basal-body rod protein FlgF n=1 Tax=Albidovulum aquaemixtae TaxID=1542388 RepID=A0A2R8BJ99_9RHOB|nr:flagellar hook-basal body complex protein [Defluviimonas aquaemixtae]SPH23444.1 Flagellar basal-body rod protein FlgG [Defluviimonas aquaemixtae]
MDNAVYTTLNRQSGLQAEMRAVANNIANVSTTGFRKEGVIFAEHVAELEGEEPSLSMGTAEGRVVNLAQGVLVQTGGAFDLAIEGEGFFQIETREGPHLTRAGAFTPSLEGELVTAEGHRLLDLGGAPVFVPTDAGPVAIASDGTVSAGGNPIAQIGLFVPSDPADLIHKGGTRFAAEGGIEPFEGGTIFQGFLENSNVNAVTEIARMIEVQRAYEMGQGFLDAEDQRIRSVIQALGRT